MLPVTFPQATLARSLTIEQVPSTFPHQALQQILTKAGPLSQWKLLTNPNGSYSVQAEFADGNSIHKALDILNSQETRMHLQAPSMPTMVAPRITNDPHAVEITNLPPETTEQILMELFRSFGKIEFSHLYGSDVRSLFGIVRFADATSANQAIGFLNGANLSSPSGHYFIQCKHAQIQSSPVPNQMLMESRPASPVALSSRSNSSSSLQDLGIDSGSQPSSPVTSSPVLPAAQPITGFSVAPLSMSVAALPMPSPLPSPMSQRLMVLPQQPVFIPANNQMTSVIPLAQPVQPPLPAVAPTFFYNPQNIRHQKKVFPPGHAQAKPVAADLGEGPIRGVGLFIFHLPLEATEHSIKQLFEKETGIHILRVTLMKDPRSGWNRGYGFVNVNSQEEAEQLITRFTGYFWYGKRLKIELKKSNSPRSSQSSLVYEQEQQPRVSPMIQSSEQTSQAIVAH